MIVQNDKFRIRLPNGQEVVVEDWREEVACAAPAPKQHVLYHDGIGYAMQASDPTTTLRITTDLSHAWHLADRATAVRLAEAWNKREGHTRWRAVAWDVARAEKQHA